MNWKQNYHSRYVSKTKVNDMEFDTFMKTPFK